MDGLLRNEWDYVVWKELVGPEGALDRRAPNPAYQKEMERRDRAMEAHDREAQQWRGPTDS